MPIYEYECSQCKKTIEVEQHITDAPLSVCPYCGQPVRKLISSSSFQLRGGGWYADGYSHKHGSAPSCSSPSPCSGGGSCPHCHAS